MLHDRQGTRAPSPVQAQASVGIAVPLLVLLAVMLLADGVTAVYSWNTPDWEGWLLLASAILFGLAVLVLVGAAFVRRVRRGLP